MLASFIDWDDVHVHDDPAALERPPLLLQDSHSRAQWQIVTDSGGSGDNSSGDGISANSGDHGHDNSSDDGSSDGSSDDSSGDSSSGSSVIGPHPQAQ